MTSRIDDGDGAAMPALDHGSARHLDENGIGMRHIFGLFPPP
jgi:hypothetical protein